MPDQDFIGVTLAHVDPALLSCWEEMVKQGAECSLLLKHNKGKVIATLQCTTSSVTSPSSSSAKKKKSKGNKEKKLERLLAYHQRLVVEKGLPPSRLMEQHAAASSAVSGSPSQSSVGKLYPCDQCDFATESQRGLKVHVGRSHKSLELPQQEKVRDSDKTVKHLEASPSPRISEKSCPMSKIILNVVAEENSLTVKTTGTDTLRTTITVSCAPIVKVYSGNQTSCGLTQTQNHELVQYVLLPGNGMAWHSSTNS